MVSTACLSSAICFLLCTLSTFCFADTDFYVTNGITPDILQVAPPGIVTVLYKGGVSVNMCNQIDPRKLREPPTFAWEYQDGLNYTLIVLDLDAPSRDFPVLRSGLHMLAMNITNNNVYSSNMVYDYIGPAPMINTGLHRYLILVYQQSPNTQDVQIMDKLPIFGRFRFSLNEFVNKYYLSGPIAGNCFLSEFSGF